MDDEHVETKGSHEPQDSQGSNVTGGASSRPAVFWMIALSVAACVLCVLASAFAEEIYLLAAVAFSGGLFAFVYLVSAASPLVFIMPAAVFTISLIVTRNPMTALAACLFAVPGFVLAQVTQKKPSRTRAVITVSISLIAAYLIYTVLKLAVTYGGLLPDSFRAFYEHETGVAREILSSMTVMRDGEATPVFTESGMDYAINYMIIMLPAIMICVMNVAAYITTLAFYSAAKLFGAAPLMVGVPWKVAISPVSARFFCGAYIAAVLCRGIAPMMAVSMSLILILTPGFAIVGLTSSIGKLKTPRGRSAVVLYLISAAILFLLNPLTIFLLAAFIGVAETFIEQKRIRNTNL